MRYRVTITEKTYYQINLEADDQEHAKDKALDAHTDGIDVEIDSEVTDMEFEVVA